MSNPTLTQGESPERSKGTPPPVSQVAPSLLLGGPVKGLVLTGRVASVDAPVNRSGFAKAAPHAAYSMNFRTFQIFANKVLYSCQDSRNDEKSPTGQVTRLGIDMFPVIEEESVISVVVTQFEVRSGEVKTLICDTTRL